MSEGAQYAGRLAVRWTVGNVHPRGFEMLRLSIACMHSLFGPDAKYLVCVNEITVAGARMRTGDVPEAVEWRQVTRADMPRMFLDYFEDNMIEGMGWKLVPLRTYPERYELAIDNDCIVWTMPEAMRRWLAGSDSASDGASNSTLMAEDVDRCLGSFDPLCPPGNYNAGLRGLAPGEDLSGALAHVLEEVSRLRAGERLRDEIEEQGLQAAALCRLAPRFLVRNTEVSICSPFWPRSLELGTCGAHFVGSNAHHIPWNYYDLPMHGWMTTGSGIVQRCIAGQVFRFLDEACCHLHCLTALYAVFLRQPHGGAHLLKLGVAYQRSGHGTCGKAEKDRIARAVCLTPHFRSACKIAGLQADVRHTRDAQAFQHHRVLAGTAKGPQIFIRSLFGGCKRGCQLRQPVVFRSAGDGSDFVHLCRPESYLSPIQQQRRGILLRK